VFGETEIGVTKHQKYPTLKLRRPITIKHFDLENRGPSPQGILTEDLKGEGNPFYLGRNSKVSYACP